MSELRSGKGVPRGCKMLSMVYGGVRTGNWCLWDLRGPGLLGLELERVEFAVLDAATVSGVECLLLSIRLIAGVSGSL